VYCNPGDHPYAYGTDVNNHCIILEVQPFKAHTLLKLPAKASANNCLMLLAVSVLEHWIYKMADSLPETAARVQHHVQIDYDVDRELKLCEAVLSSLCRNMYLSGLTPDVKSLELAIGQQKNKYFHPP